MNWQWFAMFGAAMIAALLVRRHVGLVTRVHALSVSPTLRQVLLTRSCNMGRLMKG